jgi:hypothetical protein
VTPEQARKFLRALNVPPVEEGTEWVNASCPLAPWKHKGGTDASPSFGVNMTGSGHVFCFACGFSGSLTKLVMELQIRGADNLLLGEAMQIATESMKGAPLVTAPLSFEEALAAGPKPVTPFPEWFREIFEPAYHEDLGCHPYLAAREVSFEYAKKFDIRVDTHNARVVWPIRDREQVLAGMHGRTYLDATPPYHAYPYDGVTNRHVWLGEHTVDPDLPILMVESVFDHAAVWDVYDNSVSPLSASISRDALFRIRCYSEIVLMFDSDDAGKRARTHVRAACPDAKFHDVWCPEDLDPGDLSQEMIEELLYPALRWYMP